MPIEQNDPCERARQLREVRDRLITGQSVSETDLAGGNGTQQRVKFNGANLAALNAEIEAAERKCEIIKGNRRPRRFAIMPR